jgi:energy-coupling factor transporter ATP-binding protein EcfA2
MLTVHSLTLDHVAGVDHARLELPETGVVVIHGPNEMGKTTLLTAFRLLLSDVPVGSRARKVKELKSASQDVASTVSADLTVGDHRLTVTKSFNKGSGACELVVTAPRRENLTGRQAAERFSSLLSDEVDTGLLDALTIDQGESLDILAAAGIRSLEQALGGDRDPADGGGSTVAPDAAGAEALVARIDLEYSRYFTRGGKPSKELAEARKALATATEDHRQARQRYDSAQGLVTELERLRREKEDIARQEPDAAADEARTAEELEAGRRAAEELDRHRSALAAAQESLQLAEQRRAARAERVRTLTEADEQVTALTDAVAQAEEAARKEEEQSGELRTRLTAERRGSWVAKAWSDCLAAREEQRAAETTLGELTRQCTKAEEISATVAEKDRVLQADPATPQILEELRRAGERLDQVIAVRNASATTVQVTGPEDGTATVDGDPVSVGGEGETVHVTSRRELRLGDYTVTVVPARDVHEADEDVSRAAADRDRILATLDAADPAAAEDAGRRRAAVEEELRELRIALAQVTGDRTTVELAEARDRASTAVADVTRAAADALDRVREEDPEGEIAVDGIPAGAVDDPELVTATAAELRAVADASARRAESLQEDLDTATRTGAVIRLEGRRGELDRATADRDRRATELETERGTVSDAELDEALTQRRTAVAAAERALAGAEEKVGDLDVDLLGRLASQASTRVRRLRERAVETGSALSRASGALSQHSGVAEALEATRTALERAERAAHRVERQAAAAELLHTSVQSALTAARERYEAPFRGTFEKLARTLYGAPVGFEFAPDLTVARRSFQGVSLDTDQLSGGAREQLAVLTCLSVADLVGGGDAVPVFIDDALGFSDRGRIGRMNLVLSALGTDHQIIILTCDSDRFDGIDGATFLPMETVRATA